MNQLPFTNKSILMKFFDNKQNIYKLVKVLTPVQILLWLQVFEPFAYSRGDDTPVLMLTLAILSFGLYLMFRIFYKTATKFQKLMLHVFIGLVLVNISLGFFNEYWLRDVAGIRDNQLTEIKGWLKGKSKLPKKTITILENDSVLVLGIQENRIGKYCRLWGNIPILPDSISIYDFCIYDFRLKKSIPDDFIRYRKLIDAKLDSVDYREVLLDFCNWQFAEYTPIFIAKDKCDCMNDKKTEKENCYFTVYEDQTRDNISPILFEIIDGKFDDRLRKFYHALEEIFWPTYATAEYKNDPYFLIYQGKYKEAREGLKNLPCDRRVFCEKKLEKLGY